MGFEFDLTEPGRRRDAEAIRRLGELDRHWRQACEEFDAALARVRTLTGAPDGSSILIAARTHLLNARRRRMALAEEIERLEAELDPDGSLI